MKEHRKHWQPLKGGYKRPYMNEKAKRLQLEDKVKLLEAADFQRKELLRETEIENQRNKAYIRRLEIRVKSLGYKLKPWLKQGD